MDNTKMVEERHFFSELGKLIWNYPLTLEAPWDAKIHIMKFMFINILFSFKIKEIY